MRAIIIEDDKIFVRILQELVSKNPNLELAETFYTAEDATAFLKEELVDLIFLDVSLPNMSGMDILPLIDKKTQIIFVTGDEKYAAEAFNFNVVDYLVKPISSERFTKAVDKAKDLYDLRNTNLFNRNRLYLKENNVYYNVHADDVLFVEALGDYVTVNTKNRKYTLLTTMKQIEQKLPEQKFARVHRSFIVNIDRVDTFDGGMMVIDKKLISIGKSYRQAVTSRLNLI
jgi:DNA-binding LytR/AlgR family response regulator